ncbi:cysteine--tRNA ligase [Candidatus Profftella armatura (Diaphorina cf. continua)]|uniref:Cysteine--tRNA ligase n=1 Tax=Candidatus Profftella armatura (Diaphorina cf. continua) TaxID=2661583 RepID=A0A7R6VZZ5_9PROT|nr:cysteine--tRNA ligase [Candidatus Profftella armatura (Diaphorina cf. continua)]BCG49689.1 cysteine--tRNA ligase [Candidatus Profftella armatura (Diaphorina cf. continua)]
MSTLKIYNSLSRKKQIFYPITPGKVGLYVCGITAYDYCHLGHARLMIAFDVVQRWLRINNYDVKYVRNITDIDDKIIDRAKKNNESIKILTSRFIKAAKEDSLLLNIQPPDYQPCATNYIPQILKMIEKLIFNGLAYQNNNGKINGDVNYSVRNFSNYGKLSGRLISSYFNKIDKKNNFKQDPLDFALWKISKNNDPHEAVWNSRWGAGRPGWHIECSAMSCDLLGSHFDIHGGGQDLQFPHHENEIAQSEGVYKHKFVNYWMHSGFVKINNKKMSKSFGNFCTIRDVLKKYNPEVIRFFFLRSHYRSTINYSEVYLNYAKQSLIRLYLALKEISEINYKKIIDLNEPHAKRFIIAMNDDFNTPVAISVLFDLANIINKNKSIEMAKQLRGLGNWLGLLEYSSDEFLKNNISLEENKIVNYSDNDIKLKIYSRSEARKKKKFLEADQIRQELINNGIILEDMPNGKTEWRRI